MRRGALGAFLVLVTVTPAGCAPSLPPPTAADVGVARAALGDVDAADLARGRELTAAQCGGCHPIPLPGSRAAADWPRVIEAMRREHDVALTDEQSAQVSAYLLAVAGRTRRARTGDGAR